LAITLRQTLAPSETWVCLPHWVRIYKTLRITPAMAANLPDRVWDWADIVAMMDEGAPKPGRPKTYKKCKAEM
jgi:hypothetical protein